MACSWDVPCACSYFSQKFRTLIFVALLVVHNTYQQTTLRNFPPLFNVAKERPLSGSPTLNTCGAQGRSAFCKSSTFSTSVNTDCRQDFCVQECPYRSSLPEEFNLLFARGFGTCVNSDTVNVRPGARPGDYSVVFSSGPQCYVTPLTTPSLGIQSAMTLTLWVWQGPTNMGTVIEKWSQSRSTIFKLRASNQMMVFLYMTAGGLQQLQISESFSANTWTFVALQIYDKTISYYINGVGAGGLASGTSQLSGKIQDENGDVRIGQDHDGADQFIGRLQDIKFFSETLTNREIQQMYSATLPPVFIQSECRCPPDRPRIRPAFTKYCIRNGVPDNSGDEVLRLNNFSHPLGYLNDGDSNSFWVSSFLEDVTLTLDLQDQYQVFYIVLQFYSPLPKAATIERRLTSTGTWEIWQYYADDCQTAYGFPNNGPLPLPSSVNCIQFGTNGLQIPYSKGNITFSVLASEPVSRPGQNDFYNSPGLFEFVKASQIRIRMREHYFVAHPRHKYYGIYEFIITGRCNCYGHATTCDTTQNPYTCNCAPDSFTQGNKCEQCLPLYNDKPFRAGDQLNPFNCKPCECYGHADKCVYNSTLDPFPNDHDQGGGGVCVDCRDNTVGQRCDVCRPMYYRPEGKSLFDQDVCEECDCFANGIEGTNMDCEKVGGQCNCKINVEGRRCDQCRVGFFNLLPANPQGCEPCSCYPPGAEDGDLSCHTTVGQCNCKEHVRNINCNECDYGFFNLSASNPKGCDPCNCNPAGSTSLFCDPQTGQCQCKERVTSRLCNQCEDGFYNFSAGCLPCDCDADGSIFGTTCHKDTGQCQCKLNVRGVNCDECVDGYYGLSASIVTGCRKCNCNPAGLAPNSSTCDKASGDCECKPLVTGRACDICMPYAFDLQASNADGCRLCGCDPSGSINGDILPEDRLVCDNAGQCECLNYRSGIKCDKCDSGYFLNLEPGGGCNECQCQNAASEICDAVTGACTCTGGKIGKFCDQCPPQTYADSETDFCEPCNCEMAGSLNETCHPTTGSCFCKKFVKGDKCNICIDGTSNLQETEPFGCSKAPSQQPPPKAVPLNATALRVFWDPPDHPNGEIRNYTLFRNNVAIATVKPGDGDAREYNDTNLMPFNEYSYSIEARNDQGTARSPTVTLRTPAGAPAGALSLDVTNIQARTAILSWNQPNSPNGLIQYYRVNSTTSLRSNPITHIQGLFLSVRLTDLEPFTIYTFVVSACTLGGCLDSPGVNAETRSDIPEGQGSPEIEPMTETSLYISWTPPEHPNGIIIYYELWMRGMLDQFGQRDPPPIRIFHPSGSYIPRPTLTPGENAVPPPETNYTMSGLEPFTLYEFQVLSENSIGKAASPWTASRTLEAVPLSMPTPAVSPLKSGSLQIAWMPPDILQARGIITSYNIYYYKRTNRNADRFAPPFQWQLISTVNGSDFFTEATGFLPYTNHTFIVEACNSAGCVNSSAAFGFTAIAAPQDMGRLYVDGYNATSVKIEWQPPIRPNSPIVRYEVHRITPAFNFPPLQVQRGIRFPGGGFYRFSPGTIPQGVTFTGIQFSFKTGRSHGLILYAASPGQTEVIIVQVLLSRLYFIFDAGTNRHCMVSPQGFNVSDNAWHRIRFTFIRNNVRMLFDGNETDRCEGAERGNVVGNNTGVYIGGLPSDFPNYRTADELGPAQSLRINRNYEGCISNFKILTETFPEEKWVSLDFDDAEFRSDAMPQWEGCPEGLNDDSVHFLGTGFMVSNKIVERPSEFRIKFRTELSNGLLAFFPSSGTAYWYIQLVDGKVVTQVFNGSMEIRLEYTPTESVCDGNWHELHVRKLSMFLEITVDNQDKVNNGLNRRFRPWLLLRFDSYANFGGLKPGSTAEALVDNLRIRSELVTSFAGCMYSTVVLSRSSNLNLGTITDNRNVRLDGCPPIYPSGDNCKKSLQDMIYDGGSNITYDSGLLPYTEYIYQVIGYNQEGRAQSNWFSGRTLAGAPTGVRGPLSVTVRSGYLISATWAIPPETTGTFTMFKLLAYNMDNTSMPPVVTEFKLVNTTAGNITDVIPATNYLIKFVACTDGGCTESMNGTRVKTFEEEPEGVLPPASEDVGGSFIVVSWKPPAKANGNLTGYFLFVENVERYSGALLKFNVTDLQVYTGYRFMVQACTQAGCTNSPVVNLQTSQLPPSFVSAPSLTVLGPKRIRVDWTKPEQLNGVLERYVIQASTMINAIGSVVYNSTEIYLFKTVDGLVPGTSYYFRVSACTAGGCRLSEASSATTVESAPEGIQEPNITSPSPSELIIRWGKPRLPNGIILQYRLFHNGLMVFNDSSVTQYAIRNLLPWSLHEFRVEACTIRGCGSSDIVEARTQESPPTGVVGMELEVVDARTARVKWNTPKVSNGLLYYDVFFGGIFYVDPENWDYSTVEESKSMFRTTTEVGDWVTIDDLIPFTEYQVYVNVSNTKGFIISNTLSASMPPGSPDGVKPPTAISPTSTTIKVNWEEVGRDNSIQKPVFQLQFKDAAKDATVQDIFTQPTTSTSYTRSGLLPFTEYYFRVVASNSYGETRSEWTSVTTLADKPSPILAPVVNNVGSRSVELSWSPPEQANGVVRQIQVIQNGQQKTVVDANATQVTISDLVPFNNYTYQISYCTSAGCTTSIDSQIIRTLKASPEGLQAPIPISDTPTSVRVLWTRPSSPNGQIMTYTLERRQVDKDGLTTVVTRLASLPLTFTDRAAELSPFTRYEYRVIASSAAGNGYSPWAQVTTKSSSPGGVRPPFIVVLNASAANVSWSHPIKPNGLLESYTIKLPRPEFMIRDVNQTFMIINNLTPFTEYQVSIVACSDGGCTESIPTRITTNPSLPAGQQAPKATPHSQSYISILWLAPLKANGPNIRYELQRSKISQPLEPDAPLTGFNTWLQVYTGPGLYYEDRGLTFYTTYQYRVTVYNDYGQITSDPSEDVITFGGTPSKPATVQAEAINHTTAQVRWEAPNVFELQGGVVEYEILLSSDTESKSLQYGPDVTQTNIGNLLPSTRYEFRVKLTVHGGATITSLPAFATTLDGAPEGLPPPQLLTLNDTTLQIMWTAPQRPNGEVIGYYIYINNKKYDTGMTTPGSYIIYELIPYTIYTIQMEVCTEFACSRSDAIIGTTAEALPSEIYPPTTQVRNPSTIHVSWIPPSDPNGIVLRYDLMRRDKLPCNQAPPTTTGPPPGKCQYLECKLFENFCGAECYSGPKTCCKGSLYQNKANYECCDDKYVPRRNNPNDICCGGQFYTQLPNHQCCGGRYVQVRLGQVCCPDPKQNRVDIGNGDACCATVPFYVRGAQLCCKGKLVDKLGKQCCGDEVVDANLVCCGNATTGMSHEHDPKKICCGSSYVHVDTSVCCSDVRGFTKVHTYRSAAEKQSSNQKCCGIERISSQLSCCNSQSYNPASQSCADISEMRYDCGQGTVCPMSAGTASYCDRCDFDRTKHKCGSFLPKSMEEPKISGDPSGFCWTGPSRILSGLNFSYTDTNLQPYTEYEYAIAIVNGAGSALSDYITAITLPTKPEDVRPPRARVDSSRLDTIFLSWDPPGKPNGVILQYVLLRDGVVIFRDPTKREYMDNNAIQPYQTYKYVLQVCTNPGCTSSEAVNVATLQSKPDEVLPPVVASLAPSVLMVIWRPPKKPNGYITQYKLVEMTLQRTTNFSNTQRQHNITGLSPYTKYDMLLTACTAVGCSNSTTVTQYTMEALPDGMPLPRVVIVSATSLEIHWQAPTIPNGKIGFYLLYYHPRNQTQPIVMYTAPADVFMYTVTGLKGGERYSYSVEARNTAGGTLSEQVGLTMPLATPLGIQAPQNVTVLGPRSIKVEWRGPSITPETDIDQYLVVLNAGQPNEVVEGVGLSDVVIVDTLKPFTEYEVRIQACLINVPVGCATGPGTTVRTTEAAPENQPPPNLYAQGPSVVQVSWDEPKDPNGVIIQYRLHRRKKLIGGRGLLINVLNGNTQTYIDAGPELIAYTEYEYQITAVNTQGETASQWAAVRTHQATPSGMGDPTISDTDAFGAKVTWPAPTLPNGVIKAYHIEWREQLNDPTLQWPSEIVTLSPNTRSTTISGMQPNTKYQVRVKVTNGAGELASYWKSFTTDQASPSGIQSFSVEQISSGRSVILRWEAPLHPNGRITNYLIYEEGNINAIYQGLTRTFEYRRLEPFTSYTIQLEACTIAGCGRTALQTFTTAEVPPENQPAPSFGTVNATHVVIRWAKPVNSNGKILRFEVLRRVQSLRTKRDVSAKIVYSTDDTDADKYEYVDSNLKPYSKYEYRIRATNNQGSTESPWQMIETMQAAPLGVIAPVVTLLDEFDKVKITWSEPVQPNGIINMYQLQRNNSVPWSFSAEMPKEYTDTGLLPFVTYSYVIKACTAIANGCTVSSPTLITTRESSPYFVKPPTLTVLGPTAILAQWTSPQITNGQIKEYRLKIDDITQYTGSALRYTARGLIPYKGYNFVLSACTTGGCTDSVAVLGRPSEAAPTGMSPPTLRVTSSTSVEISWEAPEQPNGVITSYEVRRDGVLIDSTNTLQFIDYAVNPGRQYTYRITAFNSQGSVTSPAASAVTYSSSPSGMNPPTLEARSSTSIKATWDPPLQPNGAIHNYTLFMNSSIVFSDRALSAVINGLEHWSIYLFRVEACTSSGCATSNIASVRTLGASPMGISPPTLTAYASSTGAHDGVLCEWLPPLRPNGVVTKYELFRRNATGLPLDVTGPKTSIYTGPDRRYIDRDQLLQPFTRYEYMARVYNSKGFADSIWAAVTTKEGSPEGVVPPRVKSVTPSTITLEIFDPVKPNGIISHFEVFLDNVKVFQGRSSIVILGEDVALEPFREYEIFIKACTVGGCTRSDSIEVKTSSEKPEGMIAPLLENITRNSIDVSWSAPADKNGVNLRYELKYRQACPPPYAVPGGPVQIPCKEGVWISKIRGLVFGTTVDRLLPYTTYEFQVEVSNEAGKMEDAPVASAHTRKAPPEYIRNQPPKVQPSGNLLIVDWSESFFVNGDIRQFVLYVDLVKDYTGYSTTFNIFRQSLYKSYQLKITLETDQGTASSPFLRFDPTAPDIFVDRSTSPTGSPTSASPSGGGAEQPFYQQVWFIVVISILILIILFISLAFCLRSSRHKVPYVRERMPLHHPHKIPLDYGMEIYGSSMDSMELPPGPVTLQTGPPSIASQSAIHSPSMPHVGYVNPAFAQMQHQTSGLIDLNLDEKLSHKSSKWEDDDDWDINLPPDSGLHSLAYGEEYDAASDRPISVLKEHTMFTDTHL